MPNSSVCIPSME